MTYEDINTMISGLGLSYTYYQFPEGEAPDLPYILFYYPSRDDFLADGTNYQKIVALNIELYTKEKDFDTEEALEAVLEENGLIYDKEEQYINEEHMYEVLYTMEVMLNVS